MGFERAREIILNPANNTDRDIRAAAFVVLMHENASIQDIWAAEAVIAYDMGTYIAPF